MDTNRCGKCSENCGTEFKYVFPDGREIFFCTEGCMNWFVERISKIFRNKKKSLEKK
jgi:YHS domain-containing protein